MSNNQRRYPMMSRMLHASSGRHNFDVVKPDNKYRWIGSRQKRLRLTSPDIIQQQTHEAIKTANESNLKKIKDECELVNDKQIEKQSSVQHTNITCDGCFKSPIMGDRYKCMFCPNLDFCQDCKSLTTHQHDLTHPLIYIRDSNLIQSSVYAENISEFIHLNTRCVGCSASPIIGIRYHCIQCAVNLCEKCEFFGLHDISHKRLKTVLPDK